MKNLTLSQILDNYELPRRFLAYFSAQCIKETISYRKLITSKSLKAIEIAERFGNGEDFTLEELTRVSDEAYAASTLINRSRSCTDAALAVYYCIEHLSCNDYLHAVTIYASSCLNKDKDYFKPLLLDLINKRLTKLQKLLIFGEDL